MGLRRACVELPGDGNRGELWRTLANLGGQFKSDLESTKMQAFGGSNPSPSARFEDTFTVEMLRDFA